MADRISFDSVLDMAQGLPGAIVDREVFLRETLGKRCDSCQVEDAIRGNPARAGISRDVIDELAESCISSERMRSTVLSAAAGIPGGLTMIPAMMADGVQTFAHAMRLAQMLAYLYGWSSLYEGKVLQEEGKMKLALFLGVMFGVTQANRAIVEIMRQLAEHCEKALIEQALTKGTLYPIVKQALKVLGVQINKQLFSKTVAKAIPLLGAVLSGGMTYVTMGSMARSLKKELRKHYKVFGTTIDAEIVDAEDGK